MYRLVPTGCITKHYSDKHISTLHWRHNDHVSNHQPHGCLLNRLFRRRSKKTSSSASLAFVWGIHQERWIPRTKGQLRRKCFHLMTSSWYYLHKSVHRASAQKYIFCLFRNNIPGSMNILLVKSFNITTCMNCWLTVHVNVDWLKV